jgi:hypothetical protein
MTVVLFTERLKAESLLHPIQKQDQTQYTIQHHSENKYQNNLWVSISISPEIIFEKKSINAHSKSKSLILIIYHIIYVLVCIYNPRLKIKTSDVIISISIRHRTPKAKETHYPLFKRMGFESSSFFG